MAMVVILGINVAITLISVGLKLFFILAGFTISAVWFLVAVIVNLTAWFTLTTYDFAKYLIDRRKEENVA
jgi:hypothetical protein